MYKPGRLANSYGVGLPRSSQDAETEVDMILEPSTYPKQQLHLVLDNYWTHKHPDVVDWLSKHRRFHFHFTPTSARLDEPGRDLVLTSQPPIVERRVGWLGSGAIYETVLIRPLTCSRNSGVIGTSG